MTQPPSEPEATRPDEQPEAETPSPGFPSTPPQQGGYSQQGGYGPPAQPPTGPPPGHGPQGGSSKGFPPPAPGGYGPPPGQGGYGAPPQGFPPAGQGGYGAPAAGQPGSYQQPPGPASGSGQYPPPAPGYGPPPTSGGYGPPPGQGGYGDAPGFPPPPGQADSGAPTAGYGAAPGQYGPPPGQYGPPQAGYGAPQGQYGPPPGFPPPAARGSNGPSLPPLDISKVGNGDWIVLGLGVLLLIFSFFGWLSVSYSFLGVSESYSLGGWNRFWWLAPLLVLAITGIRATQLLTGLLTKEVKTLWLLYGAVAAVVIYLISLIDIFVQTADTGLEGLDQAGASASVGAGFGIWASIILSLAFVYFLALSLQSRGEKLPVTVPGPKL